MPAIMASLSPNLFSSPPPPPPFNLNDPIISPPPLPPRNHHHKPQDDNLKSPPPTTKRSSKNGAFNQPHNRTQYIKPVSPSGAILAADAAAGRAVVVDQSGVSFRVPGAPFDFQYSYSETPKVAPLAIREPAFLPFAPPSMPRPWTGKAPLMSKKEKARKKGIKLFRPLGEEEEEEEMGEEGGVGEEGVVMETRGKKRLDLGVRVGDGRSRQEVLGKPLTKQEMREMVKPHLSHNRQVNLGKSNSVMG